MASRTTAKSTNGPAPAKAVVAPAPIELTDEPTDEFDEREPLFSLRGTVYTVPVKAPVADTLLYSEVFVEHGIDAAILWAMKRTLGEAGYRALVQHRSLTEQQLADIIAVVRSKFDGSKGPKGRPSSA